MGIGETLLKITDYPFAYSLAFIFLRFYEIDPFSENAIIYFAIAGFGGTILAILDPFGRLFKLYFMTVEKMYFDYYSDPNYVKKTSFKIFSKLNPKLKDKKPLVIKNWNYIEGAFHTKSIELEKDKILSAFYFLLIIAVVILSIPYYENFDNVYPKNFVTDSCNMDCGKIIVISALGILELLISIVMIYNGLKFFKYVETVSTYLMGIGSLYVTKASSETLSKFIETGDWKTAEYWKNNVYAEQINEEALKSDRKENQKKHISEILRTFSEHYKKEKQTNFDAMTKLIEYNSEQIKNLEEILKSYPLYNELIEHLFTNHDQELYNLILEYFDFNSKFKNKNKKWMSELKNELDIIISKYLLLSGKIIINSGFRGENGQWINTDKILEEIKRFLQFDRTELLPPKNTLNTKLWEVRFFDSSSTPEPRNDIVAQLYKKDADTLTVELGNWIKKIRESFTYSQTDYERHDLLIDKIENNIQNIISSYSVMGDPLSGSCTLCRNETFFEKNIIDQHKKLIPLIPSIIKIEKKFKKSTSPIKIN